MNIAEQIRLKLQLRENSEVEYKSAAGGFPKVEFWRSFSALANTNGGTIVLGVKEKNHKFTPDGLTEELIEKYRKQFWDDAHNKSCVNIPLLVESDIEEIRTGGATETLAATTDITETTTEIILKLIRENSKITAKEIASVCGITEDGVSYHIRKLKKAGKIIRVGGSRNGGEWKIV